MGKRNKVFIDPGKIMEALNGTSYETPITGDDLELMINAVGSVKSRNRNLRIVIRRMISEGYPIGSGAKGYFMITNMLDYSVVINKLENHIAGTMKRIEMIKSLWKHRNPNKLLLRLHKE